jgi:hypothetical protein
VYEGLRREATNAIDEDASTLKLTSSQYSEQQWGRKVAMSEPPEFEVPAHIGDYVLFDYMWTTWGGGKLDKMRARVLAAA